MLTIKSEKITAFLRYTSVYLLILFCSAWSGLNDSIPELIPHPSPTVELKPTLTWHKLLIPVNKYFIQIDSVGTFTFPWINVSTVDTFYTPDIDLPRGIVFWRVSIDLIKWSEPDSFLIVDGRIPVLVPFEDSTFELTPILRWNTTPVPVSQFTIQVSNTADFSSSIINTSVLDTFFACQASLPLGMIYWRVKGDDSEFSEVDSFFIMDGRVPVLIPHVNTTFERKPILRWYTPPHSVTTYTITISNSNLFDSLLVDTISIDTFYTCREDLPFGMIYWRVKGDSSEFSEVDSFEVKDYRVPQLIPYTEITHETQPTLSWNKISGVANYTIEIDNNIVFSSASSIPLNDTAFTPLMPLSIGEIYWRVKSDLIDTWSETEHFTIIPDSIPILVRFKGIRITNRKPTFTWHPVDSAKLYKFILADNSSFNNAHTSPLEDTCFTLSVNLDYGKYYWKVSCSRNLDLYSYVDSLIIDSIAPITHHTEMGGQNISIQKLPTYLHINIGTRYGNALSMNVYSVNGRIIYTQSCLHGCNTLQWQYNDNCGNPVPSGVYLIAIKTERKLYINKISISR